MRRRTTLPLALLLLAALAPIPRTQAQEPSASTPIFPYPIRQSKLDNGLTILSVPFDSPGIIAYYTVVRTGSRNEVEKGLSGFAHFFEHMMFRGTEKYSETQYNDELKALGADSNAFTSDDLTCYHMTVPASALAKAVELESDRFQNLKYDEPAFQKEARAVLGEYNKSSSNPFQKIFEALQDTAYDKHTYKHTTIGFLADIQDMPNQYAYSKTFFDRWYRPDNCTIVVAGDVNHDALVALCQQHYGAWKPGTAQVDIATEPPQSAERSKALTWPTPTLPTLVMGYHIPAAQPTDPDFPALLVLAQAVFGETSPLYKQLVLDDQKAIMFGAQAEPKRDPGLFLIFARVPEKPLLAEVQTAVEHALADAARTPLDPARLDAIKSHLRYAFAASLDSADAVALALAESIATTGQPTAMNDLYAAFERLTPADLQRVAARYFDPSNRTRITLTPTEPKPATTEEAPR
jgi:zinc protease